MKRFHVHVSVDDIDQNIAFYSKLFGVEPAKREADYAKWMLDDPRINFAISNRGEATGLDHLGMQTDDATELAELFDRATAADMALLDVGQTTCCYAESDKHWVTDPQGIAWEHFHTLADVPIFGKTRETSPAANVETMACCAPRAPQGKPIGVTATEAKSSCC